MSTSRPESSTYGWQAVPRSLEQFLKDTSSNNTIPFPADKFDEFIPKTDIAQKIDSYAKQHLPVATYNHSLRVFLYGISLQWSHQLFPKPRNLETIETFYLSCLLHDIGTVPANMEGTRMSFELWGAIEALRLLEESGSPRDQAELVAETINRHQDLGEIGKVPVVLAFIYFGTLLDNIGANSALVHEDTIKAVTGRYPRLKWTSCFSQTILDEIRQKPWAHTTVIDDFEGKVLENKVMEPFE